MKTLQLKPALAFLLIALITFASCKKDSPAAAADPIVGNWVGMYGDNNEDPNFFFAFNILPGGVLEKKNKDNVVQGTGTWKIQDGTFIGVYTYFNDETYNMAAKYDEVAGTLYGSWGEGNASADDGEFFLKKQ